MHAIKDVKKGKPNYKVKFNPVDLVKDKNTEKKSWFVNFDQYYLDNYKSM